MTGMKRFSLFVIIVAAYAGPFAMAKADMPAAIAAPGAATIAMLHAQGAQIYECKADSAGKLTWQFREPVATLLLNGKTVGRHYAGPSWELADGSVVTGKVVGRAPGATGNDIPLLKLTAASSRGAGLLTKVTTIQRLNTQGGTLEGACDQAGGMMSVPYAADYAFLQDPELLGRD